MRKLRLYDFNGQKYTLTELKEKSVKYLNTMENIVNKAKADRRELTAAETADFENLQRKFNALNDFTKEIETPVNTPVYAQPRSRTEPRENTGPAKDKTFRGMFHGNRQAALDTGGFRDFEEFLSILDSGRHDPRLIRNAMTEGVPSSGGFAVPEEYGALLLDSSLESEIVRPRATIWPMKTETRKVPAWDNSNHTDGSLFGGFKLTWLGEGATATRQEGKLRLLMLTAHKAGIFTQASRELVEDGSSWESQLGTVLTKAIGWGLDYYYLNGSGAAQPLGVLNSPSIIVVSKETGQAAGTIVYENCVRMFARLHPSCLGNAVWIANQTILPQMLTMTIAVGTGGSFIPAVMQANGQFTLLGKPLLFTEKVPSLGNQGDLLFVDLSQYAVGLRKEVVIDKSNAPGWTEDMQDYRAIIRTDGQTTWDKAITPKNGDSLSWAVTLATR